MSSESLDVNREYEDLLRNVGNTLAQGRAKAAAAAVNSAAIWENRPRRKPNNKKRCEALPGSVFCVLRNCIIVI